MVQRESQEPKQGEWHSSAVATATSRPLLHRSSSRIPTACAAPASAQVRWDLMIITFVFLSGISIPLDIAYNDIVNDSTKAYAAAAPFTHPLDTPPRHCHPS